MNLEQIDIVGKYYHLVSNTKDNIQADALDWVISELKRNSGSKVLDFGCGNGRHKEVIQRANCRWFGADLVSSPEVDRTLNTCQNRVVYDGRELPFKSQGFDVIFSCQVLEHVQDLQTVCRELARVCKIGGKFIGSTSHMEPYHSNSLRSLTPYGLEKIMEETGFQLQKIRAGVDCFSLICTRIFTNFLPKTLSNSLEEIIWSSNQSPLNRIIHLWGKIRKIDPRTLECVKLQFCGHFVFQAIRI